LKVLLVDVRGDEVAAKADGIVAGGGEASAFDRLVAVNVRGVFLGLQAVLPILLEKQRGAPGMIDTEFVKRIERANADPGDPGEGHGLFIDAVPMQRYGQPEEMARIVRFLLSDEASYVQGANWPADGRMQAGA
jgi:NAD(P)-dependent dehydrogenase (short-subunit alcohol dehydrogenase family)